MRKLLQYRVRRDQSVYQTGASFMFFHALLGLIHRNAHITEWVSGIIRASRYCVSQSFVTAQLSMRFNIFYISTNTCSLLSKVEPIIHITAETHTSKCAYLSVIAHWLTLFNQRWIKCILGINGWPKEAVKLKAPDATVHQCIDVNCRLLRGSKQESFNTEWRRRITQILRLITTVSRRPVFIEQGLRHRNL